MQSTLLIPPHWNILNKRKISKQKFKIVRSIKITSFIEIPIVSFRERDEQEHSFPEWNYENSTRDMTKRWNLVGLGGNRRQDFFFSSFPSPPPYSIRFIARLITAIAMPGAQRGVCASLFLNERQPALALAFRERRINETRSRGKFLRGLLIDAVYGGRDLARLKKWNKARREIDGHSLESLTNVS